MGGNRPMDGYCLISCWGDTHHAFDTYKAWLYERNPLPGVAKVAINLLLDVA